MYRDTTVQQRLTGGESPQDLEALGGESELLGYSEFAMARDDVLFLRSASGGGYGDPLDRDPAAVLDDLREGLTTEEIARAVYGVAVTPLGVDISGTEQNRAHLREARRQGAPPTLDGRDLSDGQALHPLRQNLEVARLDGEDWVRCVRCQHGLCPVEGDWTQACIRLTLPPDHASPTMTPWNQQARLLQLCCPACGALFDCDLVEAEQR